MKMITASSRRAAGVGKHFGTAYGDLVIRRSSKSTARNISTSHEIAKLIGSPPGYLGHRETQALLSQEVLNQHHTEKMKMSLVLFDEIEKHLIHFGTCCLGFSTRRH